MLQEFGTVNYSRPSATYANVLQEQGQKKNAAKGGNLYIHILTFFVVFETFFDDFYEVSMNLPDDRKKVEAWGGQDDLSCPQSTQCISENSVQEWQILSDSSVLQHLLQLATVKTLVRILFLSLAAKFKIKRCEPS